MCPAPIVKLARDCMQRMHGELALKVLMQKMESLLSNCFMKNEAWQPQQNKATLIAARVQEQKGFRAGILARSMLH